MRKMKLLYLLSAGLVSSAIVAWGLATRLPAAFKNDGPDPAVDHLALKEPIAGSWHTLGTPEDDRHGAVAAAMVQQVERASALLEVELRDQADALLLVRDVLEATLEHDYDAYAKAMADRGLEVDTVVAAGLIAMLRSDTSNRPILTPDDPDNPVAALRFLWENPGRRRMTIEAIDISSVGIGTGLLSPQETWEPFGYVAQWALWTPPTGRLTATQAETLDESRETLYVQFRAKFGEGYTSTIRLILCYHPDIERWIPVMFLMGNAYKPRPFPLL